MGFLNKIELLHLYYNSNWTFTVLNLSFTRRFYINKAFKSIHKDLTNLWRVYWDGGEGVNCQKNVSHVCVDLVVIITLLQASNNALLQYVSWVRNDILYNRKNLI